MQPPRVRVILGRPEDTDADIVVLPGTRPEAHDRTVVVAAPRWRAPDGPERALANAYREAMARANGRRARSMALPATLSVGIWPVEMVTRVALTVILSTPTTLEEVVVAARTPGMLERWAEALARETRARRVPPPPWT